MRLKIACHGTAYYIAGNAAIFSGTCYRTFKVCIFEFWATEIANHATSAIVCKRECGTSHLYVGQFAGTPACHSTAILSGRLHLNIVECQVLNHTHRVCIAKQALIVLRANTDCEVFQSFAITVESTAEWSFLITDACVGLGRCAHVNIVAKLHIFVLIVISVHHVLTKGLKLGWLGDYVW